MFYVTVIGSGSAKPTKQRLTTSVAVQREGDLFFFDCCEGAQRQLLDTGLRPSKLRAICISHLDTDHMIGLVPFLQTLSLDGREEPLTVIGPPETGKRAGIRGWIDLHRKAIGLEPNYPLKVIESEGGRVIDAEEYTISCRTLDHRRGVVSLGFRIEEADRAGRFDVEAALGLGIPEGPLFGELQRGGTVELPDGSVVKASQVLGPPRPGSSLAYCVDTRPCSGAIELARDTDLFICESTYAEDLSPEAPRRGHSTARQAAEMAARAGANRLLLIHFSARYSDPSKLLEEAGLVFPHVEVAQDLMELQV